MNTTEQSVRLETRKLAIEVERLITTTIIAALAITAPLLIAAVVYIIEEVSK